MVKGDVDGRYLIVSWFGTVLLGIGSIVMMTRGGFPIVVWFLGVGVTLMTVVNGAATVLWRDDRDGGTGFCPDCGAKKVIWEAQRGFNEHTGKPHYNRERRCPDWTINSQSHAACGNRVKTDYAVIKCLEHTSLDTTCSACVSAAVKAGVYTPAEAALLTR